VSVFHILFNRKQSSTVVVFWYLGFDLHQMR